MHTFSKELIEWLANKELTEKVTTGKLTILVDKPAKFIPSKTEFVSLSNIETTKKVKVPAIYVYGTRAYHLYYYENEVVCIYKIGELDSFKIDKKGTKAKVELTEDLKEFIDRIEQKVICHKIKYIESQMKELRKNKRTLVKALNNKD